MFKKEFPKLANLSIITKIYGIFNVLFNEKAFGDVNTERDLRAKRLFSIRVAIIGGGINGYCCAVKILEHFKKSSNEHVEVTIISDAFSPNTTGDGSAGLWGPYLLGGTSQEKVYKWSKGMHDFLQKIWLSEDAGEAGVCLLPVVRIRPSVQPGEDFWKVIPFGAMPLTQAQLAECSALRNKKYTYGIHYVTFTSEPSKLLPYLMKCFRANGGKTVQAKVDNLAEFINKNNNTYDVFINCTGLGSMDLINDRTMYPVRGQVARVKANWMYYAFLEGTNYVIPNTENVVLGGTHQVNDGSTEVYAEDKKFIMEGCRELVAGLSNATHLYDWVGLRPGRDQLRLETERIGNKFVIHNYGHGGAGVTLSWGCAEEVLELLQNGINANRVTKSKL